MTTGTKLLPCSVRITSPTLVFADDENVDTLADVTTTADKVNQASEGISDVVKVDFSTLGKKTEPEGEETASTTTGDDKSATQTPTEGEKAATEAPEKKEEASTATPATEKQPEGAETTETEAKPEVPVIPEDDKDLDEIQPKPGAGTKIKNDFDKLREAAKQARAAAKETQKKAVELEAKLKEASTKPSLTPEQEKEISDLKSFRQMMEIESDPTFKAEFDAKVNKSEETIFEFLSQHGMPEEALEQIKAEGVDNWKGWGNVQKAFQDKGDFINLNRLSALIQNRVLAADERQARVKELSENRDRFLSERVAGHKSQLEDWTKKAVAKVQELTPKYDWANPKEIPPNASPELKAQIEKHNASIAEVSARAQDLSNKLYNRDPDTVAQALFSIVDSEKAGERITAKEKELDTAKKRIADLENQIAKIRNAGKITREDNAAPRTTTKDEQGLPGGSAQAAWDEYQASKTG